MMVLALLLLVANAVAGLPGPTPAEFAKALSEHTGRNVNAADLRRLCCKDVGADEPTEAKCRWQQRVGVKWRKFSTYVAIDARGWHLIDEPYAER